MQPLRLPLLPIRLRVPIRAALLGVTALAFVGVGGPPVSADELSDLKAQVEALMKRIEDLEAQQAETAKKAEEARKAAERLPLAAPQRVVTSGNDKVKLTLSGQVNRVSFVADDGTEANTFHSDNENSSTRWRLVGSAKLRDDLAMGMLIEQDIGQTNNSSSVDIDTDTSVDDASFDNRHLTVYMDSKKFGRVWIGKGDTSSNNITQFDLSGTSVVEYTGLEDIGGGLKFRTAGVTTPDGPQVSGGSDAIGTVPRSSSSRRARRSASRF